MSRIENTAPYLLASLFSVDGNDPATGAEITEANEDCDATIEALTAAYNDGTCEGGANGADVALVLPLTDYMDSDIIRHAESLKAGWDCIDELDDEEVEGPDCDSNYVWRVIAGHAYLVFNAHGLCGIRADYIVSKLV